MPTRRSDQELYEEAGRKQAELTNRMASKADERIPHLRKVAAAVSAVAGNDTIVLSLETRKRLVEASGLIEIAATDLVKRWDAARRTAWQKTEEKHGPTA